MTSDETITAEWDEPATPEWVAELKDDGPHTTSELVLIPAWTQSEWDREQVRKLRLIEATAADMRDNLHVKAPEALIYDALLKLECYRMAALLYPQITAAADGQPPRGPGGRFIARETVQTGDGA